MHWSWPRCHRPHAASRESYLNMCPYQYVISLRIWHPTLPKEQISNKVGRNAKYGWTAGDPRLSPKGNPIGGLRKSSYWTSELTSGTIISDPVEVEQALSGFIDDLAPLSVFFNGVHADNGKVELFVGLFSEGNIVVDLDSSLMGKLAQAGLSICLDYYPWKTDENQD